MRRASGLVAAAAVALAGCRERAPLQRVAGGDPGRGREVIAGAGCGACHRIPGVPGAYGLAGPPLTDFAGRAYIAGRLANTPEHLVVWIRSPQSIEPGTAMPDLGLSEQQARDAAAYLYTLGGIRLGPPHLLPADWLE